tara:strand:- start:7998 stop:8198 length:201 start_codon:yes stop_codon:yes gene_type:complete
MSISDEPAFPTETQVSINHGMTYRLWLIGQIAGGQTVNGVVDIYDNRARIIDLADAIIKRLDDEKE